MTDAAAAQAGARVYVGFRSPYSRLGLHVIARAGEGARVRAIAFTGPPEGMAFADPTANPAKRAYYVQDVARMTRRMGLPLARPDPFDPDYRLANRALAAAAADAKGFAFALAVSDLRWGEGRDISDPAVLARAAQEAGWTGFDAERISRDPEVSARLKAERALIEADGVFGVPFLVDAGEKFWGHDRIELWAEGV